MHCPPLLISLIFAAALPAATCLAETIHVGPDDDWFTWLTAGDLHPGDELVLAPGVYSDTRRIVIRHSGSEQKPITIRASENGSAKFARPDAKQNTLNLEGCQHLRITGLEITGGSSAIRIGPEDKRQSNDVTLDHLHIHHIGGVAITCNHSGAVYQQMNFHSNHIHHTSGHGEAFYLGGNNATALFSDSVIQNNYIHHLDGPSISQGDGIELKLGSFGNRVVGNVIHDTRYPGITAYGTHEKRQNLIQNNYIWNTGDHGIQIAADAIIRNNFVARTGGCGIYSREHQQAVPGNLTIDGNLIVTANTENPAIRIIGQATKGVPSPLPIQITNNLLFAQSGKAAFRAENGPDLRCDQNRGRGTVTGSKDFANSWQQIPPRVAKLSIPAIHPAHAHLSEAQIKRVFSVNSLSRLDGTNE